MATQAQIVAYIRRVARELGIPEAIALAVAQFESGFNPNAISSAGAIGIMQLMPGTAESLGVDPYNWRENVQGGIRYLRTQFRTFGNWQDAYAAYNFGPGNYTASQAQANAQTVLGIARSDWGWQGGGGGDGGGGGGGGGGGFQGTGGAATEPGELAGILRGFGLNPRLFDDLIHEAIVNQWSPFQFQAELYRSAEFKDTFPGIFNPDGSLKMSPAEYLRLAYGDGGYIDIARQFRIKLDRDRIGMLIHGNKSPAEWAFEASVLQEARSNEIYRQSWNQLLQSMGKDPLDKGDWFNFVAGRTNARIENLHEAATLLGIEGVTITSAEALAAARQIGLPGEMVDLKVLVNQLKDIRDFVAPELRAAGITDADLAVLESGADPKNLRTRLEQIVKNRQALVGAGLGGGRAISLGGTLFPEAQEGP